MEWIRGPAIGRGATATVSLAATVPSGEIFAVKSAELCHSMFLQRENYVLSKLSCSHIVKYIGCDVTNEPNNNHQPTYNLCIEYVPGGTLSDEIRDDGGKLDEEKVKLYSQQILQGLDYLHANGVVHCDIKSQNILIGNESTTLKIADLGCAKLMGKPGFGTSAFSGTPAFMAPEVARGEEQGFEADIWAFGCVIIEMSTGDSPWPELNDPVSALYKIGFSGEVPEIPNWLSEKGKDFLGKCLSWDAKQRWTAKELLQHPFLGELINTQNSNEVKKSAINNSPSSVLEQGFWDSLEMVESPKNFIPEGIPLKSPNDRIKQLVQISTPSPASNWTWNEDWITVRSNGIEENLDDSSFATVPFMDAFEEELEIESSSLDIEELPLGNSVENINDFISVSDDISVLNNLNFETVNENSCSIIPINPIFLFSYILHVNFLQIFLQISGERQR